MYKMLWEYLLVGKLPINFIAGSGELPVCERLRRAPLANDNSWGEQLRFIYLFSASEYQDAADD